jgi:hypothetical protein
MISHRNSTTYNENDASQEDVESAAFTANPGNRTQSPPRSPHVGLSLWQYPQLPKAAHSEEAKAKKILAELNFPAIAFTWGLNTDAIALANKLTTLKNNSNNTTIFRLINGLVRWSNPEKINLFIACLIDDFQFFKVWFNHEKHMSQEWLDVAAACGAKAIYVNMLCDSSFNYPQPSIMTLLFAASSGKVELIQSVLEYIDGDLIDYEALSIHAAKSGNNEMPEFVAALTIDVPLSSSRKSNSSPT